MNPRSLSLLFALTITLLTSCTHSEKPGDHTSITKPDKITSASNQHIAITQQDSIQLTALIRKIYKWHQVHQTEEFGFEPKKKNPADTLYTGIDFNAVGITIKKLKATGFVDDSFLNNYRKIALRMDSELKSGKSTWREGDLPPFNDDSDPWCNCQDYPDDYGDKLTLTNIKPYKGKASFKWTWGDNFSYKVKAVKQAGVWKISYLQGFDLDHYNWAR